MSKYEEFKKILIMIVEIIAITLSFAIFMILFYLFAEYSKNKRDIYKDKAGCLEELKKIKKEITYE